DWDGSQAAMHASAVMSILAGKSIGVAPDVAVTFYANQTFVGDHQPTWVYHAQAINEILDENAKLPPAQRIRVIAVSWGYDPAMAGFQEIKAAVARAKQEGVFVLTTTVEDDYPFFFYALGRDPLADPNDLRSYRPGSFWADQFRSGSIFYRNRIMVPMDSRTTASPTGTSDYVFYRIGGLSWAIPYLEGLYALGLQVKPDLTPEEFYRAAVETGLYNEYTENGMTYRLGPIVNPAALIRRLQG
ncbi:MAG: S8/S53 family peptidase, partial [Mycobacterium leprae]